MEYSNCCRICLTALSKLFGIFEFSVGITLSEKIMYCASVEINPIDCLPKYICCDCKYNLDIAFKFKTDCEESNTKLQRIFDLDGDSIKGEIVFFDDSSLLHEETVSSNIETEIEVVNNSYNHILPSPENAPLSNEEDNTTSTTNMDEKVVVIQMNANIAEDISKSVTEKLSKSPVGRHIAKKNSSQVPRKINRCPDPLNNTLKSEIKAPSKGSSSEDSDNQLFACSMCHKYYETHKQLIRHIRTHAKTKLYVCKVCNKRFKNKYNLSVHSFKHSGKFPLKCKICQRGFANVSVLKRHAISHNGETPFQCKYCKKEFPYEYSLRVHEAIHVDRPKYTCEICFKIFSYTNSLSAHMKTHKGMKPHACNICPSIFTRNTSLRRHTIQNHAENRLISCKFCQEEFQTKDDCTTHENTFHVKVKCDFCSRRFSNRNLLLKHLKIHKSFPCKVCNKKYKSNNALMIHCKRIHN